MMNFSPIAQYVLQFVNRTNRNLFLTGKAGTGKTTLLREILRTTHKNTVVVAPTGVAAMNAGGVTIHSFFQLPFSTFLPIDAPAQIGEFHKCETRWSLKRHFRVNRQKRQLINSLELLIIDEVSMLRADVLDAMDFMLRYVRNNQHPFGGVQVLFIGDLLQLPPVVGSHEEDLLRPYYRSSYFFHAKALMYQPPLYVELDKIYRQSDPVFIDLLNELRHNRIPQNFYSILETKIDMEFDVKKNPGVVVLTTHNSKADRINRQALDELPERQYSFSAEIVGDFPERLFPLDENLDLKVGAQVMFVKNDLNPEKRFFNGKMAVVHSLSDQEIQVKFTEDGTLLEVDRYEWQHIRYWLNPETQEVEEKVLGTFVHYPLRLAWAITVHKSQGLTFDRAALDINDVFAPGQAYVAFSRLRSLEGLILLSKPGFRPLESDAEISEFEKHRTPEDELQEVFEGESRKYLSGYVLRAFDFRFLCDSWRSVLGELKQSKNKGLSGWLEESVKRLELLMDPAQKFQRQLEHLFYNMPTDGAHIQQRIDAAFEYFHPVLRSELENLYEQILGLTGKKRTKALMEEFQTLESDLLEKIVLLFRVKKLVWLWANGGELIKENLKDCGTSDYRVQAMNRVKSRISEKQIVVDDPEDIMDSKPKKISKKPTLAVTYEMWLDKMSLSDIAQERQLTEATISGHIARLIENGLINILEVIPQERMPELENAFREYSDEEGLGGIKENYGDEFSWNELKFYKGYLRFSSAKKQPEPRE